MIYKDNKQMRFYISVMKLVPQIDNDRNKVREEHFLVICRKRHDIIAEI